MILDTARGLAIGLALVVGAAGLDARAEPVGSRPATAVLEAARASVVAVLPDWPDGKVNTEEPEGSAVAIAETGLLLTADHVLGRATEARVRLGDGRVLPARIVARDRATDLAVLSVKADLPGLSFGGDPDLGEPVCALGNTFGLGISVSCGIVSATGRGGIGFNAVEDFVQTDAAVNPGASGGALIDASGRLVGVLSAIFTKAGDGDLGVNFAVSAALSQRVLEAVRADRSPRRSLGLRARPTPPGPERPGLEVLSVAPDGAAAAAGIAPGDVVLALDGWPVRTLAGLRGRLERADAQGRVLLRSGDETRALDLELED